jgi:hypothetical protein
MYKRFTLGSFKAIGSIAKWYSPLTKVAKLNLRASFPGMVPAKQPALLAGGYSLPYGLCYQIKMAIIISQSIDNQLYKTKTSAAG